MFTYFKKEDLNVENNFGFLYVLLLTVNRRNADDANITAQTQTIHCMLETSSQALLGQIQDGVNLNFSAQSALKHRFRPSNPGT